MISPGLINSPLLFKAPCKNPYILQKRKKVPCSYFWVDLSKKCKFKRVYRVSILIFVTDNLLNFKAQSILEIWCFNCSFLKSLELKIKKNIINGFLHRASKSLCSILVSGEMSNSVRVSLWSWTKQCHVLGGRQQLVLWRWGRNRLDMQSPFLSQFTKNLYTSVKREPAYPLWEPR